MMRRARLLLLSALLPALFVLVSLVEPVQSQPPRSRPSPQAPAVTHSGTFTNTSQSLGNSNTHAIALGRLDADADLDIFAANVSVNRVWLNDGAAVFNNSGQSLGNQTSNAVALGNLDGVNGLDAFVVNDGFNKVWLNNGSGSFTDSGQTIGGSSTSSLGVALGDLDGDNDLDAFIANNGANEVWLNGQGSDPLGTFSDSGQTLGSQTSRDVVLGDVDGDGDLDALVANGSSSAEATKVWLNNGGAQAGTLGTFSDSGQSLDTSWNTGLALADLDGDNDLDLFLTSWTQANSVWFNQGGVQLGTQGVYSDSGQALGSSANTGVDLADVDGDGDLDALVANWTAGASSLWLNQGGTQGGTAGLFADSGQTLGTSSRFGVTLADLDGDNDPDAVFAAFGPNEVWRNGPPSLQPFFDVNARVNPAGRRVYPWAQPGDANLPVALSRPATQTLSVIARVESPGAVMTETIPFNTGESTRPLTITNPGPNPSQTYTLTLDIDLTSQVRANLANPAVADNLNLVFIDADQGQPLCFLCVIDWMVKLMGFETSFWKLHHFQLTTPRNSLTWGYYAELFQRHSLEISTIIATNPSLLWEGLDMLETWTPAVQALDVGEGFLVTINQGMVDELVHWFEGIQAEADPELAGRLAFELNALDPDAYVGENMDEAATRFGQRIQTLLYFPVITSEVASP